MRTGAIVVKKVRGEVNPADLFTKHLVSREKVHQLLGLFGCEYRSGRAESAPKLRPMGEDRMGGHSIDDGFNPLPTFAAEETVLEAELHDGERLPHMYSANEIKKMFPTIHAAPACDNSSDWIPTHGDDNWLPLRPRRREMP